MVRLSATGSSVVATIIYMEVLSVFDALTAAFAGNAEIVLAEGGF